MKKYILLAIFVFPIVCYSNIQSSIKIQENVLKEKLNSLITNDTVLHFKNKKNIRIEAFPVCSLDTTLTSGVCEKYLRIENQLNFFIIHDSIDIYYLNNIDLDGCYTIKYSLKTGSTLGNMIAQAKSKSDTVFLLYIKDEQVVGYFIKGKLNFIDNKSNIYESIKSLIEYRFGSQNSYVKEVSRENFERNYLKKITVEDAKLIAKNYSYNYFTYSIYDPPALANAIIFEIEQFQTITSYQRENLKRKLEEDISYYKLGTKDLRSNSLSYYADLFKSTIDSDIQEYLLFDQYWVYKSNEDLYQKAKRRSYDILIDYFNLKHVADIEAVIKKGIFHIN